MPVKEASGRTPYKRTMGIWYPYGVPATYFVSSGRTKRAAPKDTGWFEKQNVVEDGMT